jgi:uncharacterized repeat protein (TIGR03943 family)
MMLGATAVRLAVTDEHLRFVKPSLAPWLLVAGVALCLLAVADCVYASRDDGGGTVHPGPRVGLLLLLPVAVVFAVAPPALGSFSAERTAAREPAKPEAVEIALPEPGPDGYRPMRMSDYTARVWWGVTPSVQDEKVRLTGFVTPRPGGGWWLTRMQIACCAADGSPVKVLVRGDVPAPPADTWVQLDGTGIGELSEEAKAEDALAEVVGERVSRVPAPASPYED